MEWLRESEYLLNTPKTERGWNTLFNICEAAERAFYEKGYNNTSVIDITQAAGVGSGTFYIYFDTKLSIYKYLLTSYHHDIRKNIYEHIKNIQGRRKQEREGLRYWFDYVEHHRFVFNITWESFFIDKELFDDYYSSFAKSYIKRLEASRDEGEIADDIDLEVLSFILMGIANFLAVHWVVFKNNSDYDKLTDQTMKILTQGMFSPEEQDK